MLCPFKKYVIMDLHRSLGRWWIISYLTTTFPLTYHCEQWKYSDELNSHITAFQIWDTPCHLQGFGLSSFPAYSIGKYQVRFGRLRHRSRDISNVYKAAQFNNRLSWVAPGPCTAWTIKDVLIIIANVYYFHKECLSITIKKVSRVFCFSLRYLQMFY